ncbi:hypothetical protein Cylst_6127 [Cylindrospermum stagnale PCC 7417]|uniref:DUF416 domain-containing protein n=1 Tax=Cylindrospermum stagnale PCC 7417 TaxID=56107 RepID=K9X625_9NOST|nr:YjaG family protein [Cylindrospermum stagnale]AFZ28095.1 hypothetical protein Cylst_6127 [Cylindrospermum stagnale PCC 7417]
MNFNFFEYDTLEEELKQIPTQHQLAFAASICERLIPNYKAFCQNLVEPWGNPSVPKEALDEVWQILAGKPLDPVLISQLRDECGQDDIFPDDLDFGDDCYEAQETLIAIRAILAACIEPDLQLIIEVAKHARNIIEAYIPYKDENFKLTLEKDGEEKFYESIANHPFAVREIAKQTEDLQRLKVIQTLDKFFLEWLRTSSENCGKSLIDLA